MRKRILLLAVSLFVIGQVCTAGGDEIGELKELILEQGQELQQMQQKLEQLEKSSEMTPTDFRVFWKEGLRFETTDGDFKLKVGGRLMYDWGWFSEDKSIKANVGEQEDGTEVRRARLYFSGLIYDNVEFKLQFDFAGGDADLKDAYVGLIDFPIGELRMGHFKEPFSLEELTSSKYITFLERALPIEAFAPSRNAGFMLHGSALAASEPRMTWAIGVFRDTDDYGEDTDDGGYNVTGRITGLPIYEDKGTSLLHIGAAYSYRSPYRDDPGRDQVRYRARPEAHLTDRFVDTDWIDSDQVDLLGLEAAWVNGPLSVQGEYIRADVDQMSASSVDLDGYYVQANYFLTGEHRPYKTSEGVFSRVKPKRNFGFGEGPGGWEVAVRYSELDLNDGNIIGGELDNITAGLNWYLNPNMRIMWNYVHSDKETVGDADMLLTRLQIDF